MPERMPPIPEELRERFGVLEAEEAEKKTPEEMFRESYTKLNKLAEERLQLEEDLKEVLEIVLKGTESEELRTKIEARIKELEGLQARRKEIEEEMKKVEEDLLAEEWFRTPPKEKEAKPVWEV